MFILYSVLFIIAVATAYWIGWVLGFKKGHAIASEEVREGVFKLTAAGLGLTRDQFELAVSGGQAGAEVPR